MSPERDETRPVFMIGVAAEMAGMHPQTLRMYERRGLVQPGRTKGRTRLYSEADLARLRRIQALGETGLNLAGIERVLDLEQQLDQAMRRVRDLEREMQARMAEHERAIDASRRSMSTEIVHLRRASGPPAVPIKQVIPAGLRPVPRATDSRDPRRSK
ncbi:MAG: heat shock protein transcriptional repressor HspR [Actinomycetota bacterium]|jgi:MerR family transcriptional regulator/heat shock protein HspR